MALKSIRGLAGRRSASGRIVVLLENFTYPEDTRVRNEAEALATAGHRVLVLAPRGPGQRARETINAVEVRRYRLVWADGSAWSYLLEYGIAHVQLLVRTTLELLRGAWAVHINGPPDTLAVVGLLARLVGAGVVYDMHDSGPELFAAKFGASRGVAALRLAQRAAIGAANEIVVTNESQRELVLARSGRAPEHVTVVRNGPRRAEFPAPAPARGGALLQPRLVYVGTLDVQDGVLQLPELLARPELAGAQLTIVGDGTAAPQLRERVTELGLSDRVTLTGRVPHERVAPLIAEADIGLDPAPPNELNQGSTMIKIAEYLSCARPVVAYDLLETRRTAGDAALYAPGGAQEAFAQLILALSEDGERRLALGSLARERALELTWERSEELLRGVYARLA
jgi:glycosyltransferase involved in cell wall biosynthesis